jgi:predicted amidohydrolase
MTRNIKVAAAQLGPIQKADSRQAVVARMLALMRQAKGCDLIVYPELALTTFFPRWYCGERSEADIWFEREMPGPATRPLFEEAKRAAMAMSFGYAELTPDGHHFNTSILVDKAGGIVGKYRKVHLPGHDDFDPQRTHQHLEKRYFRPGDLGFPAWRMLGGVFGMCICNDRRWPETFRVLGLRGVEMVTLGFNTPAVNAQRGDEGLAKRMFHHKLSLQAGAYQNSTWVVAVAKAGIEDGHPLMAGTVIVNPDGEIVAETAGEGDELLVHDCDLEATRFGKETIFDFARHRRIEHYGLIATQVGAVPPEA